MTGTAAGARKGWETRRKKGNAPKKKHTERVTREESLTMGMRRARANPYHTPPQTMEHWRAAVSQAKGNMARPQAELSTLKIDLAHFQRLVKEYPHNEYYPVAIASTRRQIANSLDRIRAEKEQLRYLEAHKPTESKVKRRRK